MTTRSGRTAVMLYFFCELATRGFSLTLQDHQTLTNEPNCGTRSSDFPPARWPFHVALYYTLSPYRMYYLCGGTIVGWQTVITAAHCVVGRHEGETMNRTVLSIRAGVFELDWNHNPNDTAFDVAEIILHPEYDMKNLRHDVAVLKVDGRLTFNEVIRPACLWPAEDDDLQQIERSVGTAIGWGVDGTEQFSSILRESTNNLVSMERCLEQYGYILDKLNGTVFCARTEVCSGSGGSGLYVQREGKFYLRGIVVFGPTTGYGRRCGVDTITAFANIAFYSEWIQRTAAEDGR
ncbi:phenoloxidase-activating factor 1-like [Armigeres subalbatus]|uniref:phenoloxidase-activating factor 1-like n=1 Tax=Armigeres subalbatus TaxID=124917 RepID=UPI002ED2BFF9